MQSRGEFGRLRQKVYDVDPTIVAAVEDVDSSLHAWGLTLSPLERLHAVSQHLTCLMSFRRAVPRDR